MATMKTKLEGSAQVVRRLDSEKRLIKAISGYLVDSKVARLSRMYEVIIGLKSDYGEQEIRNLVDVCLRQAELRAKTKAKERAKEKAKEEGV